MRKRFLKAEQIVSVTSAPRVSVEANWPMVCEALEKFDINTPLVQVAMAATIAVETGNFRPTKELRGWPDTALWKHQEKYWPAGYFGRGYIQLMEQHNYQAAGQALDIDLVSNPDLALDPKTAALIAAWYFETNNIHSFCEASNWNAVRSTVSGPGYLKSESWSRFKRYCDALALKVAV